MIPLPLPNGSYAGWKLRADPMYCDPEWTKYLQMSDPPKLMYRPNKGGDPIIFCEGEFDALILAQAGADSITSTGGAGDLAKTCGYLSFKRPVYIATDQDEAGEAAARQLLSIYPQALRLRWEGGTDISEHLRASDLSPLRTLRRLIDDARR